MKLSYFLLGLSVFTLVSCGGGGGNGGGSTTSIPSTSSSTHFSISSNASSSALSDDISNNLSSVSSSASSQIPSNPLAITITSPSSVEIEDVVILTANATDAKQPLTYSWVVESGPAVTLSDATEAQISFKAPNVIQDTDLTLSVTVTDEAGALSIMTAKVTILSKKSTFIINGLTTDQVLVNADVVATVRNLTFKTKSNSNGYYSLTLTIDEGHLSDPVLITVQGVDAYSKIKLASFLPSVSTLMLQAGEDKVLDANENNGVKISDLSTALYAELMRLSSYEAGGIDFTNDTDFSKAVENVNQSALFYLAAIIKISASSTFELPDGFSTTLDLLHNYEGTSLFANKIYLQDSYLINKTVIEIMREANAVLEQNFFIPGTYILDSLNPEGTAKVTFNADLTGELNGLRYGKSAFTWVQQADGILIKFDVPFEIFNPFEKTFIATAKLFTDYGFIRQSFGTWTKFITTTGKDGLEYEYASEYYYVQILDTSKAINVNEDRFTGSWTDGAFNLEFNSNGTLEKTNLRTEVISTSTWSFETNKLVLRSNSEGYAEYYLLDDLQVGYKFAAVGYTDGGVMQSISIPRGFLVKPQENLVFKKADMVGIWAGGTTSLEIYSNDDLTSSNFGAWIRPWNFIEGENSWEDNFYVQDGRAVNVSCNAASRSPCLSYTKNEYSVIARNDNDVFVTRKQTWYDSDGKPNTPDYTLRKLHKLPEIKSFTRWLFENKQYYFQQTSSGIKVWNFINDKLLITDKSVDFWQLPELGYGVPFVDYNGKIRFTRDNVKRELELKSSSDEGLTVCEYDEGSQCIVGTEFVLSTRPPANIELKVVGFGSIQKSLQQQYDWALYYGNETHYSIVADAGYKIQSVTGCGGSLTGSTYSTAEIRESCLITATFIKK